MEQLSILEDRYYQNEGWSNMRIFFKERIKDELENPKEIDLFSTMPVDMATGTGKTVLVGKFLDKDVFRARNLLEKLTKKEVPVRVLVLNDRINQVNQLKTDFIDGRDGKEPFIDFNHLQDPTIKLFESTNKKNNYEVEAIEYKSGDKDKIYFSTFGSASYVLEEDIGRDIIAIDEAHHLQGPIYKKALLELIDQKMKKDGRMPLVIPMSATMDPIKDIINDPVASFGLTEYLASEYSPEVQYHMVTSGGLDKDELQYIYNQIQSAKQIEDYEQKKEEIQRIRDMLQEHLARFDSVESLCADLITRLGVLDHTIIFANGIQEVDEITAVLNKLTDDENTGVAFHCKIDEADQTILNQYKVGKKKIISAIDKLNEGTDLPKTKNIVFWRNTKSPRVFEQQFGRGLRGEQVRYLDYTCSLVNMAWVQALQSEVQRMQGESGIKQEGDITRERKGIELIIGSVGNDIGELDLSHADVLQSLQYIEQGIELTKEDIINQIKADYPTVEEFDAISIHAGENPWVKYKIDSKGMIAIGIILGILGKNMQSMEGKNEVRKIVYPEADEIEELTKEDIINQIKADYPTVEEFDAISFGGDNSWRRYKVAGMGVTAMGTVLGIAGKNTLYEEGKNEVRKIVYPEAPEIKELTREEVIDQIKADYPTVEEFDAIPVAGGDNPWQRYKIEGKGVTQIGVILGVQGKKMLTGEGKNEVRKIVYPEAPEIKKLTREEVIDQIKADYPTVEEFDAILFYGGNSWRRYKVAGAGVSAMGKILGIQGNSALYSKGKNEVRKIVYPEAPEIKELTREDIINQIKLDFPTVEDFDAIPSYGENAWTKYKIDGQGVFAIGTILGMKGTKMDIKEGRNAVRKIIFPEAPEIV